MYASGVYFGLHCYIQLLEINRCMESQIILCDFKNICLLFWFLPADVTTFYSLNMLFHKNSNSQHLSYATGTYSLLLVLRRY